MATQLHEVEFETRTIGPLVLTTPVLRRLDFRGIVNRCCPIAEQADLDHGLVAELVTQSRLSDPRALYDLPGWAERCALPTLYPEIERTGQVNDDRAGRMLDQRAYSNRNLRFRPPENSWRLHQPDFDFLHGFSGRFST